jgi:hypothetical protein
MTRGTLATGSAWRFLRSANTSAAGNVFFVGYLGGVLVATILIGIALWRSGTLPRWLPVLFVVGLVTAALSRPGLIAVPLSLPFVFTMVILATRIWDAAPTTMSQT